MLNNKESRDRILAKAKAEVGGGGLLDLIPAYGPDGQSLDSESEQGWVLSSRPTPEEIDHARTSDNMIINGRAVLKDGRRIHWK